MRLVERRGRTCLSASLHEGVSARSGRERRESARGDNQKEAEANRRAMEAGWRLIAAGLRARFARGGEQKREAVG